MEKTKELFNRCKEALQIHGISLEGKSDYDIELIVNLLYSYRWLKTKTMIEDQVTKLLTEIQKDFNPLD